MAAVTFIRGTGRRHRSVIDRDDGVRVELDGGAHNRVGPGGEEVPHDLAHLIVEDALGLRRGVWGVLASGGMFRHARVVAGRRRPDATRRGRLLVAEARDDVMAAELLVRHVCDLAAGVPSGDVHTDRRVTAPPDPAAVAAAIERLRAAARAWRELGPCEALHEHWRPS